MTNSGKKAVKGKKGSVCKTQGKENQVKLGGTTSKDRKETRCRKKNGLGKTRGETGVPQNQVEGKKPRGKTLREKEGANPDTKKGEL